MSREQYKTTETLPWHCPHHTPLQQSFRDLIRKVRGLSILNRFFCHQSNFFFEPTKTGFHILWCCISLFSYAIQDSKNVCIFFLRLPPPTFIFTKRNNTLLFPLMVSMLFLIHTGLCRPPFTAASSFEFCTSVQSNPLPVKLLYWEWKRKGLATVVKHFSNTWQISDRDTWKHRQPDDLYSLHKTWRKKSHFSKLAAGLQATWIVFQCTLVRLEQSVSKRKQNI